MTPIFRALALGATAALGADPARSVLPKTVRAAVSKVRWTPELTDELIRRMPKVEVHLHLDGSLSPKTIRELAREQGYAPLSGKSEAEIAKLAVVDKPLASLSEVLAAFTTVYPLLHTPRAVERMSYEAAMSEARHNVRYLEVRFAPALNAGEDFSMEQALKAALKGLARAERRSGVKTGVILCLLRPFALVSREQNEETVALAIRYKDRGVVAVDLAGDEAAQPLSDFRGLFAKAKAAGLRLTVHAGETPRSRDLETALDIGVDRVGHATLLASQPRLLREFQRRRIPIEVNLTSNLRTAAVKDLSGHPVRQWYAAGIPVALSTDDPGVFGIDLDHEYRLLARTLHFPVTDLLAVSFEGIDALFVPEARKGELRARFEAESLAILRELEQQ